MGIKLITTDFAKGEFWKETSAEKSHTEFNKLLCVYPDIEFEEFEGFGGAFTESSGYCYSLLNREEKEKFTEAYFGETGLRYAVGRAHMNSCDFSLENWACMNDPEDTELKSFSTERDEKYIIPLIKDAQDKSGKAVKLLLSPWSPPAFMKTNGEMNHGGKLKKEYYGMWADCIVKYAQTYISKGFDVDMISVQNEPEAVQTWDSCIYTAEEEAEFIGSFLGPKLKAAGLGNIRILIWDHNKDIIVQRTVKCMENKEAAEYIGGVAYHWYTGDHFDALGLVKKIFPDLKLYFTEGCVEYSRFAESGAVQKAEMYAHDIIGNLGMGTSAFIDWNLLLDSKGGPNHVGNFCEAPVMLKEDIENGFEKRLSYYYIGQLSRYIKPGAKRIGVSKYSADIETVAYKNPGGERVVAMMNRSERPVPVFLRENNGECHAFDIAPHSIVTAVYQ